MLLVIDGRSAEMTDSCVQKRTRKQESVILIHKGRQSSARKPLPRVITALLSYSILESLQGSALAISSEELIPSEDTEELVLETKLGRLCTRFWLLAM